MGLSPAEEGASEQPARTTEAAAPPEAADAAVTLSRQAAGDMLHQLDVALDLVGSRGSDGKIQGKLNRKLGESAYELIMSVHEKLQRVLRQDFPAPPPVPASPEPPPPMESNRWLDVHASADTGSPPTSDAPADAGPVTKDEVPIAAEPVRFRDEPANPDEWCPPELLAPLREICGIDLSDPEVYTYADSPLPTQQAGAAGWRLLGGTRRGRGHANDGEHREDAYRIASDGQTYAVAAVSDGVGSSELSRLGSEVTCRLVCRELSKWCETSLPALVQGGDQKDLRSQVKNAIRAAIAENNGCLVKLAAAGGYRPDDFNCTLLLAILHGGPGSAEVHFVQVGDGAIGFLTLDNQSKYPPPPAVGQYSGQIECCIPDPRSVDGQVIHADMHNIRAMFLCTDGVEDVFYPIRRHGATIFEQLCHGVAEPAVGCKHQAAQGPILGQPEAAAGLQEWLGFEKRGEYDDRTILILHRDPLGEVARTISIPPPPAAEPAAPPAGPVAGAAEAGLAEQPAAGPSVATDGEAAAAPAGPPPEGGSDASGTSEPARNAAPPPPTPAAP